LLIVLILLALIIEDLHWSHFPCHRSGRGAPPIQKKDSRQAKQRQQQQQQQEEKKQQ
jgi:hypothetical protein